MTVTVAPGGVGTKDRNGAGIRFLTPALGTLSGSSVTETIGGVAWSFVATGSGMELSTIIASAQGNRTYAFPISATGAGSSLVPDGRGDLVSADFSLLAPVAIGSNGQPYPAGSWSIAGGIAQFSFNDSILPKAAFPYLLDPAVSYVQAATVGENFAATGAYPQVGPASATDASMYLLADDSSNASSLFAMNFNTSSIPPSAYVEAVSLVMAVCWSDQSDAGEQTLGDFTTNNSLTAPIQYPDYSPDNAFAASGPGSDPQPSNPFGCIQGTATGLPVGMSFNSPPLNPGINQGGTTTLRVRIGNQSSFPSSPHPQGQNWAYFAGYNNPVNTRPTLGVIYVVPAPAPTQVSPINSVVNSLTPTLTIN
ncbi:MAG: hypothetical protein ACRDJU_07565, partial [Actinomycetota bacterium]